jgi:hypothetical protein
MALQQIAYIYYLAALKSITMVSQPTKVVLAQTYMGVFFICSVSDTICVMPFLSSNRRGPLVVREPQFDKHCPSTLNIEIAEEITWSRVMLTIFQIRHRLRVTTLLH